MLARIARTSYRRRRSVVAVWLGLLVLSFVAFAGGGELHNDFGLPGAESQDANDLLEEGGLGNRGGETGQIVFRSGEGIDDPAVRSAMEAFFDDVAAEVPEVGIVSPYADDAEGQVAPEGELAYAEVQFGDVEVDDGTALGENILEVWDDTEFPDGLQVELGGQFFWQESEFSSEGIGFLAAMVILLIAFGSVLAMGLPIVTALFGIVGGIAIVMLAAHLIDIPEFGPQAVMMIAIGVGIDYALLIVTRFREELSAGREPEGAVVKAMTTAGRAVFFAGSTVIIALAGLWLGGLSVSRSLAVATTAGVLMIMLASLTLLPALLGFVGRNIDKFSVHRKKKRLAPKDPRRSVWYRWSRVVQRRPAPVAIVTFVALVALAIPVTQMHLGFGDAGNRPDDDTARKAYDMLAEGFGPGYNGPLFLAVDLNTGDAAQEGDDGVLEELSAAVQNDEGIAFTVPPIVNETGDVAFVQAFPETTPQDQDTDDTVQRLRDRVIPEVTEDSQAEVLVGGLPATVVDFGEVISTQLPIFIGAVLVLSFLLLLAVFRSVPIALQAVVMNMLSIGAAYGALVAVFQWGWGAELLGLGEPGPIEAWTPMMLFAIVFGLSIDYEVFLMSRIKEEHDNGSDTSTAIADGLAKTARLITAAAAIMVSVTGAFALSDDRGLQIFGFGLAVAIAVDAAIVRTLLVPAAMELIGDRNWWLPRWLDRMLPSIDVDGSSDTDAEPAPVAARG